MIASIVRTVRPGAMCSHRVGRFEVSFLTAYPPTTLHCQFTSHDMRTFARGRTWDETVQQARELASTFNRCCYVDGIAYSVELVEDESPDRAPIA